MTDSHADPAEATPKPITKEQLLKAMIAFRKANQEEHRGVDPRALMRINNRRP